MNTRYMLYIENEPTQRATGGVALQQVLPHRVVPVRTAEEGLHYFVQAPLACEGAIARHRLPGMSGAQFFARLWQHNPEQYGGMLRLLVSSPSDVQLPQVAAQIGVDHWSHPFMGSSSMALARHVQEQYHQTKSAVSHSSSSPVFSSKSSSRLLYVDDDGMDRLRYGMALTERLQDQRYEVVRMDSPQRGFAELIRDPQRYQVVVSDYRMPQRTGLEFLRDVGSIRDLDHLLRILVSNTPTPELAAQAQKIGALFVPKERRARVFADAIYQQVVDYVPPMTKEDHFRRTSAIP